MRKKIVAGNWKMNLDKTKAESLTQELVEALGDPIDRARDLKFIKSMPRSYLIMGTPSAVSVRQKSWMKCAPHKLPTRSLLDMTAAIWISAMRMWSYG